MTDVNSIEVPQVNSLPPVPLRSEAGNSFALKSEAFVAALPAFRIGMIALESVTRQLALIAQAEALAAASYAAAAADSTGSALASKNAAATSASNAATSASSAASSASSATTSKNAAATSASNAAASETAAGANAVYAKNRIDHVITQSGLTVDVNDATQLQKALISATKLLGGANYGALACLFMGRLIYDGSSYSTYGDFAAISRHASFSGAGYLHLKLHSNGGYSMPRIDIKGYELGGNNYINEIASAYLYASYGVQQQKNTSNGNNPFFYYSSTQAAFMLRIKINSTYYLALRLDAMDAYNPSPLALLKIMGGTFTPLTMETI